MVVGAANPMWHNRGRGGAKYFRPGPSVWTPVDNVDNGVVSVKIGNRKYKKDLYLGKCGLANCILFYLNPAIFFLEFYIWRVSLCPSLPMLTNLVSSNFEADIRSSP